MLMMKFRLYVFRKRIFSAVSSLLLFIGNGILEILLMALITIYGITYKIFSIVVGITNLGFVASIVMLVLNILEMREDNINFIDTQYFGVMIQLATLHIIVYFVYKALSIKADVLE